MHTHQYRIKDDNQKQHFQSLLEDEAIKFWQTLRITSETNLKDVLNQIREEFARDFPKEFSENKQDQLTYDSNQETFA